MENLKAKSFDLRKDTVDIIVAGKGGHIGGDMSVIDTLMSLYFCQMNISPENMDDPNRDRFVLSKGHSVEAYYAVLAAKGFLDLEDIKAHFSKFGSKYIGHPNNKLPGMRDELRFSGTWTSGMRRHGSCRQKRQQRLPCLHRNG